MGVVILLWTMTALAVIVGRARRGSWKTVRRYQAGQRALARLGPEHPAAAGDDGPAGAAGGPRPSAGSPRRGGAPGSGPEQVGDAEDELSPHVRLLDGDHLPPPRPAVGGQPSPRTRRPGWARAAADFDRRPSVSIDTRTWSATPGPEDEVAPSAPRAAAPAGTDARAMASLIRVAQPYGARPRWTSRAQVAPRPAKVLVGAAAAVLALLATGVAATMHSGPSEASVGVRRAAATGPATSAALASPRRVTSVAAPPAAPPPSIQVSGDAHQATVTAAGGSAVQVTAGAPCWIQVRAGATGPVLAQSTLAAGQAATFPWQNGLWMRLGDPSVVTVSVDGRPVVLPVQAGQPIDLSFASAA